MNICTIARFVFPEKLDENYVDFFTLRGLGQRLNRLTLIVQSPNRCLQFRRPCRRVLIIHLPQCSHRVFNYLNFIIQSALLVRKLSRRGRIHLLNGSHPLDGGVVAVLIGRWLRIPAIIEVQAELLNLSVREFPWYWRKVVVLITRWVCMRAEAIRSVSDRIKEQLVASEISPQKIVTLPSRCDISFFNPRRVEASRSTIRSQLGLDSDQPAILFLGRLVSHKGLKHLLDAWAILCPRWDRVRLLLAGEGPILPSLQARAQSLDIEENIRFLGRWPYVKLPELFAAVDGFVLSSIDEGSPRALLEAMAMELPVVATRVGGVPEIIGGYPVGLTVPAAEPQPLAEALDRLLSQPDAALEWGKAGRRRVMETFEFESNLDLLTNFFQQVIESSQPTRKSNR